MLESLMNFLVRLLFIGTITCFHKEPLVVMLILGFGLFFELLITFWTGSIFLFRRFEKASLVFHISIVMFVIEEESDCLERDNAYTYNFFCGILVFFLKYFDSSLTSFCDLAGIRGEREDMKVGLTIFFPLLLVKFLGT